MIRIRRGGLGDVCYVFMGPAVWFRDGRIRVVAFPFGKLRAGSSEPGVEVEVGTSILVT